MTIWAIDARAWREAYGRLEAKIERGDDAARDLQQTIDNAVDGVMKAVKANNYYASGDDAAAESLTGAVFAYLVQSNPSFSSYGPTPAFRIMPPNGWEVAETDTPQGGCAHDFRAGRDGTRVCIYCAEEEQ